MEQKRENGDLLDILNGEIRNEEYNRKKRAFLLTNT